MKCHLPFLFTLLTIIQLHAGETWSGFQNGGHLTVESEIGPPVHWDGQADWTLPIEGYGQSSPVVVNDMVYVTSIEGEKKDLCLLTAIARQSGTKAWSITIDNPSPEKNTTYVSRAAPSPVCDANGVIAFFEGGLVVAADSKGEKRWTRNLVEDYGSVKARHGLASSLEQNDEFVFVWVEREDEPYVLALNKTSGETVWKSKGIGATSWSSPRLVPVGEQKHLVLSGIGRIVGLDPATGQHLWSFDDIAGNSTPTPVPVGNGQFLIGATTGSGGQAGGGKAAESNGLIQITQTKDREFAVAYVWRAKRATSSFGSPIALGAHAYFINRSGVVYCLDLKTGKEIYAKRTGSSVWATPIAVEDRIYLFGKDGTTNVFKSGPEFEVIATNSLWTADADNANSSESQTGRDDSSNRVLYAAAVVGPDLYLRWGDGIQRIRREQ